MADIKVKQKLKEKIDRIRRKMKRKKIFGRVPIKGVDRPHKPKTAEAQPTEYRAPKKLKQQTAVGPRGGQFKTSRSGKKIYARKSNEDMAKAMIHEIITESEFHNFFESFKLRKDK